MDSVLLESMDDGFELQGPDSPVDGCPSTIPPEVQAAFNFVAMTNQSMLDLVNEGPDGNRSARRELHPAQEQVFRLACARLGRYFGGQG